MSIMEIASVSTKGQVVIPGIIRQDLGIKSGAKLMVFSDGKNLLMRPINPPDRQVFKSLIEESRRFAIKTGFKRSDLRNIIKKSRNEACGSGSHLFFIL